MLPIAIVSMVAIIPLLRFAIAKMGTTRSTVVSTTPAGTGAAAPMPAGATTATVSITTTSRTWGWTGSWWGKLAVALVVIALILFGGPIFIWLANFDWSTTPTGEVLEDNFGRGSSALMWIVVVMTILIAIIIVTGALGKATKQVSSIPFTFILGTVATVIVLLPIATGIGSWMSQPAVRTQVVEFYGLNTGNVLRQERRITVTPLEKWYSESGAVRGEPRPENGYWQCVTSANPVFQGLREVFTSRTISSNRWEYELTPLARSRLVAAGVAALEVTHSYMVGGPGRSNPCTQMTFTGH
ncbi:MAG: hypothetical protein KBD44_02160 [Candidatus Pacebacteria bacterium]|nr:hypothetical protein [Candidatus Paceibacterota bacterium]